MAQSLNAKEREALLDTAKLRFRTISVAQSSQRAETLKNIEFVYNIGQGQWPESIRAERKKDDRPFLTSNKLRKFVSVVANEIIARRPAIGVKPVDDQSDPLMARVHEDIIRNQEYQSGAEAIYAKAITHAVAGGVGYWRVLTKFIPGTFEQEAYIAPVDNPLSAYLDPERQYGFVRTSMPIEEFKLKYPKATVSDFNEMQLGDQDMIHWKDGNRLVVCEYFWKEPSSVTLAQVHDPVTNATTVIPLDKGITKATIEEQGLHVVQTREEIKHQTKWAILTGAEILDIRDWPGEEIPIVEVCGDTIVHEGRMYKMALTKDAIDPQMMSNFWKTAMTESIALAAKAPFMVTPEEIAGHEPMWNSLNITNRTFLLHNQTGLGRPGRVPAPEVPNAAMLMLRVADDDIKDVIGIFEPGLGDRSNERSGTAIRARQSKSDIGTAHFGEHLRQAIILTGRILMDVNSRIMDTARVVRIRGENGEAQFVGLNQPVFDPETGMTTLVNDMSVGKYDVEATMRTYQSRREEAMEGMLQALQYAGPMAPLILPYVFKFSDLPGAEEIYTALKSAQQASLPPASPEGALTPEPDMMSGPQGE